MAARQTTADTIADNNFDEKRGKKQKNEERSGRETRGQFEARMRKELQDLFDNRMSSLMKDQMEATKMTARAAQQLAELQSMPKRINRRTSSSAAVVNRPKSSTVKGADTQEVGGGSMQQQRSSSSAIPEELLTLMSRAESNIPEMLSVVEATDKSGATIQRTISSAIKELSMSSCGEVLSNANITEEIAAELTSDDTLTRQTSRSHFDDDTEQEPSFSEDSRSESKWFTGKLFHQHLEDQRVRDKMQQYLMIKKREKVLTERTNAALAKIASQKKAVSRQDEKYERLCSKEKRLRKYFHEHKEELSNLRYTLKVDERERRLLVQQHRKLDSIKSFPTEASQSDTSSMRSGGERDRTPTSPIEVLKNSSTKPMLPTTSKTKIDSFKKHMGAASLRAPLSPKRMDLRRRHSSADSEDSFSMSQAETMSSADQSDLEIRIHTLQEELGRRMKTAAKLKKEQKVSRRERLKVQEDTLRKQIEVYDQLIQQTKSDIEAASPPSSAKPVVQPQIKVPKQQSKREQQYQSSPTHSTSSVHSLPPQDSEAALASVTSDSQQSVSSSTDTIIASPQKPATPSAVDDDPPVWPAAIINEPSPTTPNEVADLIEDVPESNNYSDDFTSSISSPVQPEVRSRPKLSETTVDAICGQLLESLVEDTIKRVNSTKNNNRACISVTPPVKKSTLSSTRSRPQDLMLTTFDISSESSSEDGNLTSAQLVFVVSIMSALHFF
jgi:hypothetical protein